MRKSIITLSLAAVTAFGSDAVLSVYQDMTYYSYRSQSRFIGLTRGITATCDTESNSLVYGEACPKQSELCRLYDAAQTLEGNMLENSSNTRLLEAMEKLPQPREIDAQAWVAAAKTLAKEEARLALEKRRLDAQKSRLEARFAKETKSRRPLFLKEPCTGELKLTLPYGYITFSNLYEAELEGKSVSVTQKLSLRNQSGIDIEADEAHFYYRRARQHLRPIRFSPWVVDEMRREPLPQGMKRKSVMAMDAEDAVLNGMAVPAPAPVPQAHYEDAREYTVKQLHLPSTGEAVTVPVMQWRVPTKCTKELYAYRDSRVFEVCTFQPKFQIESHSWKVTQEGHVVNEKAVGAYEEGTYRLYTKVDQDIQVQRRRMVRKERETGIFGTTVRKKDGFTLTLTNKSDTEKALSVTERIPTSGSDKIKVKLLFVKGPATMKYKLLKEGKLHIDVKLLPRKSADIEVVFEISYDKEVNVRY